MGWVGAVLPYLNAFTIFVSDCCPTQFHRKLIEGTDCLKPIIEYGAILLSRQKTAELCETTIMADKKKFVINVLKLNNNCGVLTWMIWNCKSKKQSRYLTHVCCAD